MIQGDYGRLGDYLGADGLSLQRLLFQGSLDPGMSGQRSCPADGILRVQPQRIICFHLFHRAL